MLRLHVIDYLRIIKVSRHVSDYRFAGHERSNNTAESFVHFRLLANGLGQVHIQNNGVIWFLPLLSRLEVLNRFVNTLDTINACVRKLKLKIFPQHEIGIRIIFDYQYAKHFFHPLPSLDRQRNNEFRARVCYSIAHHCSTMCLYYTANEAQSDPGSYSFTRAPAKEILKHLFAELRRQSWSIIAVSNRRHWPQLAPANNSHLNVYLDLLRLRSGILRVLY
jgi:hypothetical protein